MVIGGIERSERHVFLAKLEKLRMRRPLAQALRIPALTRSAISNTRKLRHCADDLDHKRPDGVERSSDPGGIGGPSWTECLRVLNGILGE